MQTSNQRHIKVNSPEGNDILKTEEREDIGQFTNQVQLEFPEVGSLHVEFCLFLSFAEKPIHYYRLNWCLLIL